MQKIKNMPQNRITNAAQSIIRRGCKLIAIEFGGIFAYIYDPTFNYWQFINVKKAIGASKCYTISKISKSHFKTFFLSAQKILQFFHFIVIFSYCFCFDFFLLISF